jgi:hypothetical protein
MDAQIAEQEELVPQIEADVKKLTDELESFSAIEDLKVRVGPFPNPASLCSHTRLTLSFIGIRRRCRSTAGASRGVRCTTPS